MKYYYFAPRPLFKGLSLSVERQFIVAGTAIRWPHTSSLNNSSLLSLLSLLLSLLLFFLFPSLLSLLSFSVFVSLLFNLGGILGESWGI